MLGAKLEIELVKSDPSSSSAVVLVWLPDGDEPSVDTFDAVKTTDHQTLVPEPYWLLREALAAALTTNKPGYKPWLKADESIFDLKGIKSISDAAKKFLDRMNAHRP
jgi:hypothetical protein